MIRRLWKNYYRYIRVSNKESLTALFLGVVGAFLETFSIYLLANIITGLENNSLDLKIFTNESTSQFQNFYIFIFLISSILSALIYYISNKFIVKAKCRIERFIREEITNITLNIRWEYYLKLSQGDISKSIISEGQNISEGYMYFLQSITYCFIAITYFFICFLLVPDTFLILIFYAFLAFRVYVYYSNKASDLGKNLSQITSNIGNWTSSIFNNLKYIRSISKDNLARNESKNLFLKFSNSYSNAMVASYKSKLITEILTIFFIFLSILYIIVSRSNVSNLILSLSLFVRMTPKVYNAQSRLLDSIAMISWPKTHYEKINWAKKYKEDIKNNQRKKFIFNGKIVFDSIKFNYPDCEVLFNDLSLEISENECVGIIGESGSGKSTLLDLLTGIVKPSKGDIFISGVNMKNLNIGIWRENIGIVMQDNYFKNDTVGANIALGEKIFDREKIILSLKKANAWEFVKKLPEGIDEIIYDRGMRFSGGQRQKLALARAIYSNPKILILDEPSSGLDEKSEIEFISSINKLIGSMVIIIISHKKEVVKICDTVFSLENKSLKKMNV
mgnify:CR=1 FL=1